MKQPITTILILLLLLPLVSAQVQITPQLPIAPSITPQLPIAPSITPQLPIAPVIVPQLPPAAAITPQLPPTGVGITPQLPPAGLDITPQLPPAAAITPQLPPAASTPQLPQQPNTPTTTTSPGPQLPGTPLTGIPILPGIIPIIPINPGTIPTNVDARWVTPMNDVQIPQESDFAILQTTLSLKCQDPDDELNFDIVTSSEHFGLAIIDDNLFLFGLDPHFLGSQDITLTCNGIPDTFTLQVIEKTPQPPQPNDDNDDENNRDNDKDFSIHISSIRIPDAYNPLADDVIPVTVTVKNNGDKKIENLKVAVTIPELQMRASFGPLDLNVGKSASRTMTLEIPKGILADTYYARITVDATNIHRIIHRDIDVLSE